MNIKKYRWSKVYESSEEELVDFLHARNIEAARIIYNEFQALENQSHDKVLTLWCADGSLKLVAAGKTVSVQAGDTVIIPMQSTYDIVAGMYGCVCYQA